MIKVITHDNERISKWASKHLEGITWNSPQCFGFELNDKLIGAVIFSEWTKNDIHVSVVSTNARMWQKRILRILFHYTWVTCGCIRMSALAKESNKKSRRLLEALGFKEEGRLRKYHGNEDGVVYGILKEDSERWYQTKEREA